MFLDVPTEYTGLNSLFKHDVFKKNKNVVDYTSTSMNILQSKGSYTIIEEKRRVPTPSALKTGMFKISSKAISKIL